MIGPIFHSPPRGPRATPLEPGTARRYKNLVIDLAFVQRQFQQSAAGSNRLRQGDRARLGKYDLRQSEFVQPGAGLARLSERDDTGLIQFVTCQVERLQVQGRIAQQARYAPDCGVLQRTGQAQLVQLWKSFQRAEQFCTGILVHSEPVQAQARHTRAAG